MTSSFDNGWDLMPWQLCSVCGGPLHDHWRGKECMEAFDKDDNRYKWPEDRR